MCYFALLLITNSTSAMKHILHRSSTIVVAGVIECVMVYDDDSQPAVECSAFYDDRLHRPSVDCRAFYVM